jgi:hypothetical protein
MPDPSHGNDSSTLDDRECFLCIVLLFAKDYYYIVYILKELLNILGTISTQYILCNEVCIFP